MAAPQKARLATKELPRQIRVVQTSTVFEASSPGEALNRIGELWDSGPNDGRPFVHEEFTFVGDDAVFTVTIEPLVIHDPRDDEPGDVNPRFSERV